MKTQVRFLDFSYSNKIDIQLFLAITIHYLVDNTILMFFSLRKNCF